MESGCQGATVHKYRASVELLSCGRVPSVLFEQTRGEHTLGLNSWEGIESRKLARNVVNDGFICGHYTVVGFTVILMCDIGRSVQAR